MTEVCVRLLNEAVDVWAMLPAQHVAANIYCIIDNTIEQDHRVRT